MYCTGIKAITINNNRSQEEKRHPSFSTSRTHIDLFILKNMGAAIIDFRVCPPLVKCQNIMFSGFIEALMYGFSSTGVTIYCYFGLKFNDNTCCEVICKQSRAFLHHKVKSNILIST